MAGLDAAADMLKRRPDLPHFMKAVSRIRSARVPCTFSLPTMYRIHATNEPDSIGPVLSLTDVPLFRPAAHS
jgi:hypothetical protein